MRPKNITTETFIEISAIECQFEDNIFDPDNTKHWFTVEIHFITDPVYDKILGILTKEEPDIRTDKVTIACINPKKLTKNKWPIQGFQPNTQYHCNQNMP